MKKTGKQSSGKSSTSGSQAGTSKDALQQMYQTPLSKVSRSKMTSYSKELFSTWSDIRWYQIPLSSLRRPKAGLFSFTFQSSLQKYQQLRKTKRLKVGRPFSVLPLPSLSLSFMDSAPFQDTLRCNNRRSSRAGGSKGGKRLSACRNESQAFLRRMQKKLRKCQPSADRLHPKCISSAGISGQQWETELCGSSRKTSKQGDSAPLAETLGRGGSSSLWGNPSSPLEEEREDMFPPDWTPPRIAFLYNEEPPTLSPAPGPMSESQSSGEMPDITEEAGGSPRMDLRVKAFSPVGSPLFFLKDSGATQLKELGKRHVDSSECPTFDVCQMADEELEEVVLEDQREVSNQGVLEQEGCPLLSSPVFSPGSPSKECFRSSISVSLDKFPVGPGRLACELDAEGDSGTEGSASSLPAHLLLPCSGISSRSSISASSDEPSGDPRGLTLGSDREEDMDDSSLVPLRDLLQMGNSRSSSVELSSCLLPGPGSYLSNLDKLLEEKREQIQEDRELEGSLGPKLLFSNWLSAGEAGEEDEAPLPDAQRLVLEQFSISPSTIPTVHPGENIFRPSSYPRTALVLDTAGLVPQNQLESLFFSSSHHQMAILHSGCLRSIYHGIAKCPLPVLHWLFQLMSLNPDVSADAFKALWEISTYQILSSADKVSTDLWCPELKDITQAFYSFGACPSALFPAGLSQHEFISEILKFPEYPLHTAEVKNEAFPEEAYFQLSLVTMLGDIFKVDIQ
ncbi:uncharacterized protein LOC134502859 [Candoia aspera]|uniref:uncharacterized protein LOC134502859 n=1 Tax=Candoia aspera TaxID=51853 RepID=UPI002FD804BD